MPRKRRHAKKQRAGLRFEDLYLTDKFACTWGWSKPREGTLGQLKTIQQVEALWWQERDRFMQLCTCPDPFKRTCDRHPYCFHPGERPWGWWRFEARAGRPSAQFQYQVLKKLGVIGEEERKLVRVRKEAMRRREEQREAQCRGPEEGPGPEKEEVAATNLIQ